MSQERRPNRHEVAMPDVVARWKRAKREPWMEPGEIRTSLRAVCGRAGCCGSLGILRTTDRPDELEGYEGCVCDGRLVACYMAPEWPEDAPGTPRRRQAEPIYYGFPDTGYRISYRGNRERRHHAQGGGWRVGRRPRYPNWEEVAEQTYSLLAPLNDHPGDNILPISRRRVREHFRQNFLDGQHVRVPCLIFCPVCGALNAVVVPPGFAIVGTAAHGGGATP